LHPAALQHYEQHITDLRGAFGEGLTEANEEAAERIRNLVARVAIRPTGDGFSIELQGRLAVLMDAPNLYPNMRIAASGGTVVAEERYRQYRAATSFVC
jgi:site-specific DNA recombinase